MNLIYSTRNNIGNFLLNNQIKRIKRDISFKNIDSASTIAVLFDYTNRDTFLRIQRFINELTTSQKNVCSLCFISDDNIDLSELEEYETTFFSKKNLNWYLKPNNQDIDNFPDKYFDILIDFSESDLLPLHFVTALSKAKCKIGKKISNIIFYDIVFDMKNNYSLIEYINQIKNYLTSLNKMNLIEA